MSEKFEPASSVSCATGAVTPGLTPLAPRGFRIPLSSASFGRCAPVACRRNWYCALSARGADGVLVLGCHIGDCHYTDGNHRTAKRIPVLRKLLSYAGIEPDQLRLGRQLTRCNALTKCIAPC